MNTTTRRKIARSAVKRVKRHTKASKNAKRKVRSYHSRKHRKLVKKGGRYNAFETADDDMWDRRDDVEAAPTEEQGTAYVLYDEIQTINVPMCVIFIVPKKFVVDDIYLFFNRNMTAEDITLTVKLLLGISVDFKLTPAITPPSSTVIGNTNSLRKFIGNTFVKLTSCGGLHPRTFCLKTGTLSDNLELDKVTTTTHKIETSDTTYQSLDGKKIKAFLARSNPNGFTKKVLDSKAVLPDLYEKYFIAVSEEVPEVTEDKINEYYGSDLEPRNRPWNSNDKETYDAFKERMKKYIRDVIINASKHKTSGLKSDIVNTLNTTRPLKITEPTSINFSTLAAESIIEKINTYCQKYNSIQFTELSEEWWVQTELKEVKDANEHVQRRKNARIDPCVEHPTGTDCCEKTKDPQDC